MPCDFDRTIVPRIDMAEDARGRVGGKYTLEASGGVIRPVGNDHFAWRAKQIPKSCWSVLAALITKTKSNRKDDDERDQQPDDANPAENHSVIQAQHDLARGENSLGPKCC